MASNVGTGHSASTSSVNESVQSDDEFQKNPLWKYVQKIDKVNKGGGAWEWKCLFCNALFKGTYTRVHGHLMQVPGKGIQTCNKVNNEMKKEMRKLVEESEARLLQLVPKNVPLPPSSASFGTMLKKRKGNSKTIAESFDMQARDQLDREIARMFYTAGLPFNLARNPYFQSSYALACNSNLSGYKVPGFNSYRTTFLDLEKGHVETLLEPIRKTWPAKGITIVSDGWSDPQRRPLINFMAVCGGGPMFLKSVNCAGEKKDKFFIADLIKEVIEEVGHQNVVQVITDNASNCKGAGEIISGMYPHIYWTPCVVHTLNLALKNICAPKNIEIHRETYEECHWIAEIHSTVMLIKNFIMNHGMRLSMFQKFTPLKLLSVAETRFTSVVIMLRRFKLIRRSLETMVLSDDWSLYDEDDKAKAKFVRDTILDVDWWGKLDYIVDFTAPIYDMIRACDTDRACLHLVYEMWDTMIENVKKVIYKKEGKNLSDLSFFFDVVHSILVSRWAKSSTPLHCLAHSLNPKFYSETWLDEDPTRVPPHTDGEISTERNKCFRRLFPDGNQFRQVFAEYGQFSLKSGPFGDMVSMALMDSDDPTSWWANFGSGAPLLQRLAFKVLAQPTSSSCCQRNWSTYSFIHSMKRNRLTPKRAEDLVFVHNNLRLLSRSSEAYKNSSSKLWDVGGDEFGSLENTGVLEFANLSLDEPELEEEFILGEENDSL